MLHMLVSQKGIGRLPYNVKKDKKKVVYVFYLLNTKVKPCVYSASWVTYGESLT